MVTPFLTISALTKPATPVALKITSATKHSAFKSLVFLLAIVTVQPSSINKRANGRPTILEVPITKVFKPFKSSPKADFKR